MLLPAFLCESFVCRARVDSHMRKGRTGANWDFYREKKRIFFFFGKTFSQAS